MMSTNQRSGFLLQRAKSAGPSFRFRPGTANETSQIKREPTIVMYADENRPVAEKRPENVELLGTMNSNLSHEQDHSQVEHQPVLIQTHREGASFNPRLRSSSFRVDPRQNAEYEELAPLVMYRDSLRQSFAATHRPTTVSPRAHFGRQGGAWRHIKQTNTHSNANFLFIDGTVRIDDTINYPIPQYGVPPMDHREYIYPSASFQDLSGRPTRSLEPMTWSATDELHRRPSLSRYTNRYEQHARDGFVYWPRDLTYQKPKSKTNSTGTYKTWLGLSDAILKI